jgi:hypothetical protein
MTLPQIRALVQRISERVACKLATDAMRDHTGSHYSLTIHFHAGCNDGLIKGWLSEAGMVEVSGFKGEGKQGYYRVRRYVVARKGGTE